MSLQCTITAKGLNDISEIIGFIALDNIQAALAMETDIYKAFDLIASNPFVGSEKPGWTLKPYPFWPVRKSYIIVYNGNTVPPRIMRVLSRYRNITGLLGRDV